MLGSISAALSSPVFVLAHFPEQRLVIEPTNEANGANTMLDWPFRLVCMSNRWPSVMTAIGSFRSGGYSLKFVVGVCCTLLQTLTHFQTKICDFPYPMSYMTLYTFSSQKGNYLCSMSDKQEKHTQFDTKMFKIDTHFLTKTAQNPYTLGRHMPI